MNPARRLRRLLLAGTSVAVVAAVVLAPAFALQPAGPQQEPQQDTKPADAQPKLDDKPAPADPEPDAKPDASKPDAPKPDAPPAADAQPAAAAGGAHDDHKSAPSAKVSPEAKAVIDQVDAAYTKLKSLELAGTYSADVRAAGETVKDTLKFTGTFSAPNRFRHFMEGDVVLGSTGAKAYSYLRDGNLYTQGEAPKDKPEGIEALPEPVPQLLEMQNPSLMLAVMKSPAAYLGETFAEIQRGEDVQLDGTAFPSLKMTLPNRMVVTMLFHPQTHLVRKSTADAKAVMEARGTPRVEQATFTVDYTAVTPDAVVKDDQFAWTPPAAARDLAELADAGAPPGAPGDGSDRPAMALQGKPAPDFALPDMEGKNVSLADLKGKVVVLDFWATWCGPCRLSLPHLDELYAEKKEQGVNVFAVNLEEEKEAVEEFVRTTGLKTPVLLDAKNEVGLGKYKASGIPQTVVIGKDGKVAKVFIGFGPQSPKMLKEAVEAAMKG